MLREALDYAKLGWPIFPVKGKRPLCEHGVRDATTDEGTIRKWWGKQFPDANIALSPGPVGLVVLDIDGSEGEAALLELALRKGVRFGQTLTARTGRGRHLYFKRTTKVGSSVGKLGKGLDIRSEGASAVLPPSVHANGKRYEWVDRDTQIAPFPPAALLILNPPRKRVAPPREVNLSKIAEAVARAEAGTRNDTLVRAAFTAGGFVGAGMVTIDQAVGVLDDAAAEAGLQPFERRATIQSGLKAGAALPLERR